MDTESVKMNFDSTLYGTFLIPSSRVDSLQKRLKAIARKLAKGKTVADVEPFCTVMREIIMVHDKRYGTAPFIAGREYLPTAKFAPYSWVTVRYSRPVLNGWQLIAVYDWEWTENGCTCYVSTVPEMITPPEYRDIEGGRCDHCNTNRRRKKSMLITKDFNEFKVVGTSCIKDFLGHVSANSLMQMYDFEYSLSAIWDYDEFGSGDFVAMQSVSLIMTLSSMFVRLFGYVKAGYQDDDHRQSTGSAIASYLNPRTREEHQFQRDNIPTDLDRERASAVMAWVLEQSTAGDYMCNLHKAVTAGAITWKRVALVASAIPVYQRAVEQEANKPDVSDRSNEWLGQPKERLRGIIASIQRVRYREGDFGTSTIITLLTGSGDTITWFASSYIEAEQHDLWRLDGTVKKHEEYRGTRQTVITRVAWELQAAPEQATA